MTVAPARFRIPVEDRFWAKVQIPDPEQHPDWADQCWPWLGYCDPKTGYGRFQWATGDPRWAHRVALALIIGWDALLNTKVLHACDNPPCANPYHLRVGTAKQNTEDMMDKGRGRGFLERYRELADSARSQTMSPDEMERYLVVQHAGRKMAKRVIEQLGARVFAYDPPQPMEQYLHMGRESNLPDETRERFLGIPMSLADQEHLSIVQRIQQAITNLFSIGNRRH